MILLGLYGSSLYGRMDKNKRHLRLDNMSFGRKIKVIIKLFAKKEQNPKAQHQRNTISVIKHDDGSIIVCYHSKDPE